MSESNQDVIAVERAADTLLSGHISRLDTWLQWCGDRLNPILVKETRQALKSRQFTTTFWLLLVFAAGWSFIGISLTYPAVYFLPSGTMMITGYYLILCVPLLLVVPFSAFRSLSVEKEDGTYELLSISTLTASEIVLGKLGSALLQMLIYFAALAPCIAFTYLLRGIDLGTIAILLIGTFLMSVLMSALGLVCAGTYRSAQNQSVGLVAMLLVLVMVGWGWTAAMIALIFESRTALSAPMFWIGIGFALTMYATVLVLLLLYAAAQNSFPGDNRSTWIRVGLLVQLVAFTGWMVFLWMFSGDGDALIISLTAGGVVWAVYGAMLIGEATELSVRAMRDLPQTLLGRALLTWFNPGSATGYVFACTTFGAFVSVILVANVVAQSARPGIAEDVTSLNWSGLLMWSYLAFYLGFSRTVVYVLRMFANIKQSAAAGILLGSAIAGGGLPMLQQYWPNRLPGKTTLQVMNWMDTISSAGYGRIGDDVPVIVVSIGIAMFLLQLVLAAREVEAVRLETPLRVVKEAEESSVVLS